MTIRIAGEISGWSFNRGGDKNKILNISNWGPLELQLNVSNNFRECANLSLTTKDRITIRNNAYIFYSFGNLGSEADLSHWDVSQTTNFAYFLIALILLIVSV